MFIKHKNTIFWLVKGLVFLALLTPLLVTLKTTIYPFIIPKVVFFRSLVLLAMLGYLWLCWVDKKYRPGRWPIFLSLVIYFSLALLSGIFGIDWHHSWWGNFERLDGLSTLFCLVLYALLLLVFLRQEKDWSGYLKILFAFSGLIFLAGLKQRAATEAVPFLTLSGQGRVFGTLGNYIYFGQYFLIIFWLAIYSWFSNRREKFRWVYLIMAVVSIWAIYLSGSRGPLLAWLISLAVFGFGYLFVTEKKVWRWSGLAGSGLVMIFLGLAIFSNLAIFAKMPVVNGLREIATQEGTASTRLLAWDIAWQGFLEKPILGWGWGTYYAVFNKFYDPAFLEHGWAETWFDHSHNQYLDVLSGSGALGLLAYLGVFGTALISLISVWQRDKERRAIVLVVGCLILAHLINNIFVFENPSSFLLFAVILALAGFISQTDGTANLRKREEKENNLWRRVEGLKKAALLFLAVFCFWLLWVGNIQAWQVSKQDREIQIQFETDPLAASEAMKQGVKINNPHRLDLLADYAFSISNLQPMNPSSPQITAYRQEVQTGIGLLTEYLAERPWDARRKVLLSQLYKDLYMASEDPEILEKMESLFVDLSNLSPQRQQVYYYWAEVKLLKGQYDEAVALVEKTNAEHTTISFGHWMLAKIHALREDWGAAAEELAEAEKYGFRPSNQEEQEMVVIIKDRSKLE